MKFYLQHNSPKDKKEGKNTGNVIVATSKPYQKGADTYVDTTSAYGDVPNGEVRHRGATTTDYLRDNCTEIEEGEAAIHHPNLFSFLGINI